MKRGLFSLHNSPPANAVAGQNLLRSYIRVPICWVAMLAWTVPLVLAQSTESAQVTTADVAAAPAVKVPLPEAPLLLARRSVEKYFAQAANVICTESVSQGIVGKNGKTSYREESVFEYQLQVGPNPDSLELVESRETRKASFRDVARTLLITNGFTSMLLIAHPQYETSYTFEALPDEVTDGVTMARVRFKPIIGASSPAALRLRDKNYPLPLSGTLWIDPQTGAITKLVAQVDSSLSDLGLQGMRSEIHYGLIRFRDPDESYWMPISATIDVESPKQHWRNVHRFGNYKRFKANVQVEFESKP